jgi:hypothetical protein
MELANYPNAVQNFPIMLFVILWLLPFLFILILFPAIRQLRTDHIACLSLSMKLIMLLFLAMFWTGPLIDQMPCFLGVPNCD